MEELCKFWKLNRNLSRDFLFRVPVGLNSPVSKTVLVLDSSFNPPTLAHFQLIKDSIAGNFTDLKPPQLTRVLCLLSVKNADKGSIDSVQITQRLEMIKLMLEELKNDSLELEIGLTNCAKFAEKAKVLHKDGLYPVFIVGYDTLIRLFNKKYYNNSDEQMNTELTEFFQQASLICQDRSDPETGHSSNITNFLGRKQSPAQASYSRGKIFILKPNRAISSISSTLARKFKSRETMTPLVYEFILKNSLYA